MKIYELTLFDPSLRQFGSPSILTRKLSPVGCNPCVDQEDWDIGVDNGFPNRLVVKISNPSLIETVTYFSSDAG